MAAAARAATATWGGAGTLALRVRDQELHVSYLCICPHPNYGTYSLSQSSCSLSVVQVNFPRFYGYSHMTFEPLKNSYQTFQITVEFKVRLSRCFVAKEGQELFLVLKFLCYSG